MDLSIFFCRWGSFGMEISRVLGGGIVPGKPSLKFYGTG
jgi:hypothetical protein